MTKSVRQMAGRLAGSRLAGPMRGALKRYREFGFARYCPCCKSQLRQFKPAGVIPRPDAECPICRSLERHRLIYLYVMRRTDLFDGRRKRMLHVAPEPQLSQLFKSAGYINYLSADLFAVDAMVKMDITDIQFGDGTFDVIYCSHVLEHVPDDSKAMQEFRRVLKPGGWAILQVPIVAEATIEDPTVTTPEERERVFGQADHVRSYGPDYRDRLSQAGFVVQVDGFVDELDAQTVARFGLMRGEQVYFCRKPER